jgi:hypothetical protein
VTHGTVRSRVFAAFQRVAADQGRTLAPLTDDLRLVECGLDSLAFALVVASLEDTLGVDPFNTPQHVEFPITLGEFIALYETRGA